MLAFAFAISVCIVALLVDNRCEPILAAMVGGCR